MREHNKRIILRDSTVLGITFSLLGILIFGISVHLLYVTINSSSSADSLSSLILIGGLSILGMILFFGGRNIFDAQTQILLNSERVHFHRKGRGIKTQIWDEPLRNYLGVIIRKIEVVGDPGSKSSYYIVTLKHNKSSLDIFLKNTYSWDVAKKCAEEICTKFNLVDLGSTLEM